MLIYIWSYVFIPALQDHFYGLSNIHTELPVHVFLHIEPVFRKYRRLLRVLRMADMVNPEIYNEWFQIGFSVFFCHDQFPFCSCVENSSFTASDRSFLKSVRKLFPPGAYDIQHVLLIPIQVSMHPHQV